MSKAVYKSAKSEKIILDLYDRQTAALNIEYEDLYIDTRFGKTHLLKTGNPEGKPILLFHGGNSTAPYYLRDFLSLRDEYLIYAPDTIGHPGKSAQTVLSAKNMDYGEWASDVIDGLGFERIICMGGSYGGGILVKLMCVALQKIEKSILIVPSAIFNSSTLSIAFTMGIPMMFYIFTRNEKWLIKATLPMAVYESEIDRATLEMVRCSFENAKVKVGMPSDAKGEDLRKFTAPVLLIAGEKDVLFPGEKVIARAQTILPNLKTHLMKGCGHLTSLSSEKNRYVLKMIEEFLAEKSN